MQEKEGSVIIVAYLRCVSVKVGGDLATRAHTRACTDMCMHWNIHAWGMLMLMLSCATSHADPLSLGGSQGQRAL